MRYQEGVPREAGRAASAPRAAEGVGRKEGGAARAAKALGASVSPGGAVEAGEGTRARPMGLEARSREVLLALGLYIDLNLPSSPLSLRFTIPLFYR